MKKYITSAIITTTLLLSYPTYSQTEYLVRVDPTIGNLTIINDLPDINEITVFPNYTTFDQNNKRYIFKGTDGSGTYFIYAVNAVSGLIESTVPYPGFSGLDNLIEFQYDNSTNMLYGLRYDSDTDSEFFCSVDLTSGLWKIINPVPMQDPAITSPNGMQVHFSTYDTNQHIYIVRALDNSGNSRLYRILASTGGSVTFPLFPVVTDPLDQIHELQFDNASGTLYGIFFDNSENAYSLVSINTDTGEHTIISGIPGMQNLDTTKGYTFFDEPNHRYVFRGMIANGWQLITLDATTGAIVSNPPFPQLTNTNDNVMELQFDNLTGLLYALHWSSEPLGLEDHDLSDGTITLYPNPMAENATIALDKTYNEVRYEILNVTGQVIHKGNGYVTSAIEIQRHNFSKGIYVLKIICDGQEIGIKKLVMN